MNRKARKLKEYLTHKRAEREGVMKAGWHDEIWGVNLDEEVVETTHGYYAHPAGNPLASTLLNLT